MVRPVGSLPLLRRAEWIWRLLTSQPSLTEFPSRNFSGVHIEKEIPLYASLLFDMDDVEGTAKKGLRYINDNYFGVKFGWGMIPSKPFGADPDRDEKMVTTIREAFDPGKHHGRCRPLR